MLRGNWQFEYIYPLSIYARRLSHVSCRTPNKTTYGWNDRRIYYEGGGRFSSLATWAGFEAPPGSAIHDIYALADYSLLVSAGNSVILLDRDAAINEQVIAFPSGYATTWSFAHNGAVVFVGEYGGKMYADNPRRIYKSIDGGRTFALVAEVESGTGKHVHKVLYDPDTDRLWVSQGDPPYSKLFYAEGPTHNELVLSAEGYQPTDGVVVGDYIVWGKDTGTTGILRYHKPTDTYDIPLNILGTDTDSYIFTVLLGADGAVYAGTIGKSGPKDPEYTAVYRSTSPDFGEWEEVARWPAEMGGVRKLVYADGDMVLFRLTNGVSAQIRRLPLRTVI